MRAMDIDPTFVEYLHGVVAGRTVPIWRDDIAERRARQIQSRRATAAPPPRDIEIEDIGIPADDHRIPVRVYRWSRAGPESPCIVYIHGGGWVYGSAEQSDVVAIPYCRETGAVVVSPDYRLSPEHPFPAAFEDCYRTLQGVADSADDLGIDAARIALTGESSGANLAAACVIEARDRGGPAICLQVLNYPALGTDFDTESYRDNATAPVLDREEMRFFWRAYLGGDLDTDDPRAVPLRARDLSELAPARIVTAEYDPLRDDGIAYAGRLAAAGTPVEHWNAPHLTHGFMRAWGVSDGVRAIALDTCGAFRRAFGEAR